MLPDLDPARPELYPWSAVLPPELAAAAGEIAAEVPLAEAAHAKTVAMVLRAALAILARHARPKGE